MVASMYTIHPAALATRDAADGRVLLHLETGRVIAINEIGSRVWQCFEEHLSVEATIDAIASEYDAPRDRVVADVMAFIIALEAHKLATPVERSAKADDPRAARCHRDMIVALVGLIAVDVVLSIGGFHWLYRTIRRWPVARRANIAEAKAIEHVQTALDRAAVWYPREALCLARSAVGTIMLRRLGTPATFVVGIRKVPFYAHAWIEVAGRVVNDSPNVQERYPAVGRC